MNLETIVFENNSLKIIDQTLLPNRLEYIQIFSLDDVVEAIRSLKVRGAPAIGIFAAYGLYLFAVNSFRQGAFNAGAFAQAAKKIINSRPTAVNLSWAVLEMQAVFEAHRQQNKQHILQALLEKAISIHRQDREACQAIGDFGAALLQDGGNILTHCNAGALATGGIGTALGIIYTAHSKKKNLHVYVDETRPVGQGARLTYWELNYNKVPATLIADNMAGWLMKEKDIQAVIVGADRIALNGDVANKIGTYGLAVLAQYHNIPFYVAAPLSTFDRSLTHGNQIPIEVRPSGEILEFWGIRSAEYKALNPAFDVTPHQFISAIVTERGIITKPDVNKINHFFNII